MTEWDFDEYSIEYVEQLENDLCEANFKLDRIRALITEHPESHEPIVTPAALADILD